MTEHVGNKYSRVHANSNIIISVIYTRIIPIIGEIDLQHRFIFVLVGVGFNISIVLSIEICWKVKDDLNRRHANRRHAVAVGIPFHKINLQCQLHYQDLRNVFRDNLKLPLKL